MNVGGAVDLGVENGGLAIGSQGISGLINTGSGQTASPASFGSSFQSELTSLGKQNPGSASSAASSMTGTENATGKNAQWHPATARSIQNAVNSGASAATNPSAAASATAATAGTEKAEPSPDQSASMAAQPSGSTKAAAQQNPDMTETAQAKTAADKSSLGNLSTAGAKQTGRGNADKNLAPNAPIEVASLTAGDSSNLLALAAAAQNAYSAANPAPAPESTPEAPQTGSGSALDGVVGVQATASGNAVLPQGAAVQGIASGDANTDDDSGEDDTLAATTGTALPQNAVAQASTQSAVVGVVDPAAGGAHALVGKTASKALHASSATGASGQATKAGSTTPGSAQAAGQSPTQAAADLSLQGVKGDVNQPTDGGPTATGTAKTKSGLSAGKADAVSATGSEKVPGSDRLAEAQNMAGGTAAAAAVADAAQQAHAVQGNMQNLAATHANSANELSSMVREQAAQQAAGNPGPQAAGDAAPRTAMTAQDTFSALDSGGSGGSHVSWTHTGPQRVEAAFQDPVLGQVSVRADSTGGNVHATLISSTNEGAQALSNHLGELNHFLSQQNSGINSVSVETGGTQNSFAGSGGQQSGQQQGSDAQAAQVQPDKYLSSASGHSNDMDDSSDAVVGIPALREGSSISLLA
ncbi:flagellar hook-length control protein FliK [Telmatobacter bradus]|uniref:flagellar hook-length control protein FliK n=1 Tax=Telmatobacter bradus TaxID=474953 RepID=UPI003B43AFD0